MQRQNLALAVLHVALAVLHVALAVLHVALAVVYVALAVVCVALAVVYVALAFVYVALAFVSVANDLGHEALDVHSPRRWRVRARSSAIPPPSQEGTPSTVIRTFTWKPRPNYGLGCRICALAVVYVPESCLGCRISGLGCRI